MLFIADVEFPAGRLGFMLFWERGWVMRYGNGFHPIISVERRFAKLP